MEGIKKAKEKGDYKINSGDYLNFNNQPYINVMKTIYFITLLLLCSKLNFFGIRVCTFKLTPLQ